MDFLSTALVSNALLAVPLALAVALLAALLRRPAFEHRAWLLVLLKFLIPPLLVAPVLGVAVSPLPEPTSLPRAPLLAEPEPGDGVEAEPPAEGAADLAPAVEPATAPAGWDVPWSGLLVACWLVGALGWWSLAVWRLWRFRRVLAQAEPVSPEVQELAR